MANKYTDEDKRIFAKAYAGSHNLTTAFKMIRPTSNDQTASQSGGRLLKKADVVELIQQYEQEYVEHSKNCDGARMLDIEERRIALARVVESNLASIDYQIANTALKALDILNKMDGVYIEKRQVEINKSLADVIKVVDGDA